MILLFVLFLLHCIAFSGVFPFFIIFYAAVVEEERFRAFTYHFGAFNHVFCHKKSMKNVQLRADWGSTPVGSPLSSFYTKPTFGKPPKDIQRRLAPDPLKYWPSAQLHTHAHT